MSSRYVCVLGGMTRLGNRYTGQKDMQNLILFHVYVFTELNEGNLQPSPSQCVCGLEVVLPLIIPLQEPPLLREQAGLDAFGCLLARGKSPNSLGSFTSCVIWTRSTQ